MEKTTTLKYTPDNYKELLEAKSVFEGYTYLCRYFGIIAQKSQSGGQKAHFNEWKRLFEIVKTVNNKEIKITKVYETPLPEMIKRSIYAEHIKSLVLVWLAQSEDGCIIFTNRSKLETVGLVNKKYFKITRSSDKVIRKFLKENKINYTTFHDFLTKNKDNSRDRMKVVFKNLIKNDLINAPIQIYAVKFKSWKTKICYLNEDSFDHRIIASSIQFTLETYFGVTDYNAIRFNTAKVKLYKEKVIIVINKVLKKAGRSEIDYFFVATKVQAIDKEKIIDACKNVNVKETLVTLNQIVVENIIQSAISENLESTNIEHLVKLQEINKLKEDDFDSYYDLCQQIHDDTIDKYGFYDSPETKHILNGNRANSSYVEEISTLASLMIRLYDREIKESELLSGYDWNIKESKLLPTSEP